MANRNAGMHPEGPAPAGGSTHWTFLTNHAHVLLAIARDNDITLRDVASMVGITERAAQSIVSDLVAAGYLIRTRLGRRNSYTIPAHRPMRHPLNEDHELDELLAVMGPTSAANP